MLCTNVSWLIDRSLTVSVRLCSESRLIQQHLPGQGEGSNGRKRAYAGKENVRDSTASV